MGEIDDNLLLTQDNGLPHLSATVTDYLEGEEFLLRESPYIL